MDRLHRRSGNVRGPDAESPSLNELLDRLHARTGQRAVSVVRAGAAGLAPMASGPYFAWLPLEMLVRLPGRPLSPLSLEFGRRRCPTGLVLRRSAESLAPACALRDMLGDTAPWPRNDTTSSAAWRSSRRQGPAWRQRLTLTEQTPVRVIGRVERKLLAPALAGGLKPSPGTGFDAADGFAFGVVSPAAGVSVPDDEGSATDSGSQWPGGRPLRVRRCTTCSGGSLCVPAFRPAMPNLMG